MVINSSPNTKYALYCIPISERYAYVYAINTAFISKKYIRGMTDNCSTVRTSDNSTMYNLPRFELLIRRYSNLSRTHLKRMRVNKKKILEFRFLNHYERLRKQVNPVQDLL